MADMTVMIFEAHVIEREAFGLARASPPLALVVTAVWPAAVAAVVGRL